MLNVGSITEISVEIVDKLWQRKLDVCAVQETRWRGECTRFIGATGNRISFGGREGG